MFKDDGGPLQLTRNVTVTGAQGLDTVLDLAFLQSKVQLCPALVHSLALARAGPGGLVDPRVGRPSGSSIVRLRSAQRLRLACASAAPNMQAVMLKARSKPCVDATHHDSLGWADTGDMRSLCEHEVPASRLAVKRPQACIDDLTGERLAARAAAATSGHPRAAAVAVPVVAAGVGPALWLRRRRAQQQQLAATPGASKLQSSWDSPPSSLLTD
ncbi:hypothetical protein COO60DRAFT_1649641 [Scenedesmus sp. NREL 46B-D3]|nr:hypothetical protein COO60DRAFT_1649641 [Scenedesmus sp. NREL 46B-D3]